jgi:hypothetical protein
MVGDEKPSFDSAEQAAISHAWNYFVYHAQQRQTVFNFFLILIGASIAAFGATLAKPESSHPLFHAVLGALISICSFLFWRLDRRSTRLIKLAETRLRALEKSLTDKTGINLEILKESDVKDEIGFLSFFESFSQVYRSVFLVAGIGGNLIFALSLLRWACNWFSYSS